VVPIIDNAPWRRARPIDEAPAEDKHLEFKRSPNYGP
jgi:hypothetical protein